jgi:hypothetical protein
MPLSADALYKMSDVELLAAWSGHIVGLPGRILISFMGLAPAE